MDGDVMPGGGRRGASVPDSLGETVPDNNLYSGAARETQTFNGDGGTQLSTEVTDQVTVATTATRARTGLPALTANVIEVGKKRALTTLAAGGTRTTSTTSRYDNLGRVVASTDSGDGVPDLCTTTRYADNTTSWIRDRVIETLTSQQVCPPNGVTPAPILSATRTYYDGSATLGAIPGVGDATRTDKASANTNGTLTFAIMATITFDPAGRPTSATDALNRTTGTAYTPSDGGLLSQVVTTNAKNQSASVGMEPSRGLTISTVDVGGHHNDASYDPLGRLTAVWQPGRTKSRGDSASITYSYLQRTDGPLAVTAKTLVGNNRYTTDGVPSTTLISVAPSAVDDRTVTTFDGAGRAIKATAYQGDTATWDTRTVYGGDRTTVFPPPGGVTTTTLADARGKSTELRHYTAAPTVSGSVVSGGTFQTSSYHYTPLGQLDQLRDAAGNTWTYGFDFLGRQTSASDPDSGTRTSVFDLAGQVTATTDARNQTLSYEYDPLGRKLAEWSGAVGTGTRLASWVYDTAEFGVGLVASTTRFTPNGNYLVGFQYNGDGRVSSHTVRIPASEPGLAGTYTTGFSHTSTGLVTGIQPVTLGGLRGEAIGTSYDQFGQPKSTAGSNVIVNASHYTPYGEPSQYELGVNNSTGTLTFARDAQTRRLTGVNLSVTQAFPQVDDLRYAYDPAGNLTRITNVQGDSNNGAPTRTECFSYDTLDRLSQAWTATDNCAAAPASATVGGPTPYWSSWTFDQIGLRRTQVRHALPGASGDTTTTYSYPASGVGAVRPHALTGSSTTGPSGTTATSYGYNAAGDTTTRTLPSGTQSLAWTETNRLASVTTPAGTSSYVYDADGTQLLRRDPTSTTLYLPGEEITRDNTTGALTGTRYYSHNGTVVALRVGGANISYLQADLHGTTQVAVRAEAIDNHTVTRRSFDPYGNPLGTGIGVWPDQHGFLNQPHNPATGLTDLGARPYDPTTGLFQSPDPVLDPGQPAQWPAYSYAGSNPTTLSDPSGLLYYLDDNNATIPRLQGHDQPDDPVVARADQRAHNNARVNKLASPVRNKNGQAMTGKGIESLRNNAGYEYHGSNDFTYADAIEFASEGAMQAAIVCQWMTGSSAGCRVPSRSAWEILKSIAGFVYQLTPIADAVNCASGQESCLWLLTNVAAPLKGLKAIHKLEEVAKEADHLADTARVACSFTGDTQVLMADHSTKPISQVKPGDQVLATNPQTGEQGPRTVTALIVHQDTVVELALADGSVVSTTHNHRFYDTTDKAWETADQLDPGDKLFTFDGRGADVNGLRSTMDHIATVYNLTVADIHTYHVMVGDRPVLVHNECPAFVPGLRYRHSFETSAGEVKFLAEVERDGTTLILRDVTVLPPRGSYGTWDSQRGGLGAGEVMAILRNDLGAQAARQGYTHLRITGTRITGPVGHDVDFTIPLH